jgi:hypothetical protein
MLARRWLLGVALLISCNALLDNNPRELSSASGGAGTNGAAGANGGSATDRGGSAGDSGHAGENSTGSASGASAGGSSGTATGGSTGTTKGGSSGTATGGSGGTAKGGSTGPAAGEAGASNGGASNGGAADGGAADAGASAGGGAGGGNDSCPTSCALAHAQSACQNGACVITSCQVGFLDENHNAADGCEAGDVPSSGLLLWFMADRGVTVTGELVSDWADQSPNHVHATQSGSAQMPKRVQPAGGPAVLEFDGVDDALKLPSGFAAFNGTTFFAVANAFPAETCAGILSFANGPDVDDIEFGRHHTNLLYYEVVGQFVEGATNAFEANRRLLVSIIQSTAGATQLRINGVLNASKTINVPANIARTQNFLGRDVYSACPQSYKGQLGEVILLNRAVTDAERLRMQTYLGSKWSVAVQ